MFKIIILFILFLSSLGGSVKLMDSSELSRRYPWLHTDDLSLGSLGNAILKEWNNTDTVLGDISLSCAYMVPFFDVEGRRACHLR